MHCLTMNAILGLTINNAFVIARLLLWTRKKFVAVGKELLFQKYVNKQSC
jgi:hypothetical protein